MMKKVILLLLLCVLAGSLFAAGKREVPAAGASGDDFGGAELVVATWGWAAANLLKLSADFEKQYNCKILVDETAGNADRLNKIAAQRNNPEIDIALMSDSFAAIANRDGLFEKLDPSIVSNLNSIYDFAKNKDGYGPVYSVVRYGIIYDADEIKEAPTSYLDLFNGKYNGLISLPDMASTAGPYLLIALAETLGGSQENVEAAFKLLSDNKRNIVQFYTTSSEVQTAFTTGEIAVTVFMDMNVPTLRAAGVNALWVEPREGTFSAASTINVVKNCPNPRLAQLFVNYILSDPVQNNVAAILSEAPVNKNAGMPEDKKAYLVYGEKAVSGLRVFDWSFIDSRKASWLERFQKEVTN
ncbi:MAG: ABC transporter substrate-binding protein [Spirochaetaceae bacterium]|jgi:putative spermidine/putrescine transport system substrate-binding protein|nr:ABC transporter substrate-binding protein [Spirochaetaceae bacterium]